MIDLEKLAELIDSDEDALEAIAYATGWRQAYHYGYDEGSSDGYSDGLRDGEASVVR